MQLSSTIFSNAVVDEYSARIANGTPLSQVLSDMAKHIEDNVGTPLHASVLLTDEAGTRLYRGAAPSLSESYCAFVDGIKIGPSAGSCGTAAFFEHPVYVVDIATDALWARYKEIALQNGLRACWSVPIVGSTGKILGTLALYYGARRSPTNAERAFIGHYAVIAARLVEESKLVTAA